MIHSPSMRACIATCARLPALGCSPALVKVTRDAAAADTQPARGDGIAPADPAVAWAIETEAGLQSALDEDWRSGDAGSLSEGERFGLRTADFRGRVGVRSPVGEAAASAGLGTESVWLWWCCWREWWTGEVDVAAALTGLAKSVARALVRRGGEAGVWREEGDGWEWSLDGDAGESEGRAGEEIEEPAEIGSGRRGAFRSGERVSGGFVRRTRFGLSTESTGSGKEGDRVAPSPSPIATAKVLRRLRIG